MATIPIYKLVLIINNSSNEHDEFLLVKQTPPPIFQDEEYDSFVDSALWDLPSAQLNPLEQGTLSQVLIKGANSCSNKLDLSKFDLNSALSQVLLQLGLDNTIDGNWEFSKYVEEPEFGPGPPIHTVFITGKLRLEDDKSQDVFKWKSIESCLDYLLEVKPLTDRVGPLMVVGLLNDPAESGRCKIPPTLLCKEYPPGVKLVPMGSRTAKPFHTTNLIIIESDNVTDGCGDKDFSAFSAYGDALIVDPGCRSQFHSELMEIVASLPRKLLVFVTHHHHDHVDGKFSKKY
ncbi:Metallo-hydrolase/oxidoreductase superfamily protein [Thalictrum thalictroides]|uniref:Metallo-hydrolase/oxidoreductase superfamily protein n=1 Tax=Thalictrum thalictroides TaxID=46969 RepID=A0A7J6WDS0_THATH|nr:Metallo-hydrolase/oxidoreductase superfamily protein [Thalictrum thalictroides]